MRIFQIIGVMAVTAVGAWARAYHREITRQLRGECSVEGDNGFGTFDTRLDTCNRSAAKKSNPKYTPRPAVEPSAVQPNPFMK